MNIARMVATLVTVGGASLAAAACTGAGGEAVRPKDGSGNEALGQAPVLEACAPGPAESFVVDLEASQRSDLELAMKDGLAVVSYDCRSLKIFKDCRVKGTYSYAGVTPKEDVVKLSSKDEVAANLPIHGTKISAGLERGKTIDIALITVGKQRSTRREVIKADLEGDCAGATHVVRGAYIGAYALSIGSVGEVRAAAQVFNVSAEAASRSEKQIGKSDGNPTVCKGASRNAAAAPDQCGAALRVELVPVTEVRKDEAAAREADLQEKEGKVKLACPAGFGAVGGKCVKGAKDDPLGCFTNGADCNAACDHGDGKACDDLAHYWYGRRIGADGKETTDSSAKDPVKSEAYFNKACDGGYGHACSFLAMTTKDKTASHAFEDKACGGGYAYSCWVLAQHEADPGKALEYARRGCDLGYGSSCSTYADKLVDAGKLDDADKAFARGCAAGDFNAGGVCLAWGNVYAGGIRTKQNPEKAFAAYTKGCDGGSALSCHAVGSMIARGLGSAADPVRARGYFQRACNENLRGWDACQTLGDWYEQGKGGPKDLGKAAEAFGYGCARGQCARAGAIYEKGVNGKPDPALALEMYHKGCQSWSHQAACEGEIRLTAKTDKEKAKAQALKACTEQNREWACAAAKKLGATSVPEAKKSPFKESPPHADCVTPFTCSEAEWEAHKKELADKGKGKK
jgi:hypothetical protein